MHPREVRGGRAAPEGGFVIVPAFLHHIVARVDIQGPRLATAKVQVDALRRHVTIPDQVPGENHGVCHLAPGDPERRIVELPIHKRTVEVDMLERKGIIQALVPPDGTVSPTRQAKTRLHLVRYLCLDVYARPETKTVSFIAALLVYVFLSQADITAHVKLGTGQGQPQTRHPKGHNPD